jgi:hypothetical protein
MPEDNLFPKIIIRVDEFAPYPEKIVGFLKVEGDFVFQAGMYKYVLIGLEKKDQ